MTTLFTPSETLRALVIPSADGSDIADHGRMAQGLLHGGLVDLLVFVQLTACVEWGQGEAEMVDGCAKLPA